MNKRISIIFVLVTALTFLQYSQADTSKNQSGINVQPDNLFPTVKFETNVGNIIVELDRNKAPITTNNFLTYVVTGAYDGTIFHRVVENFVVQGGGYDVLYHARKQNQPIFNESGNGLKNEAYTIAMARENNPHSATNQFYFNMQDNDSLDPGKSWGYAVFGMVMEGTDILDLINGALTHKNKELGWDEVPINKITLKAVVVLPEK
jgi:peptidyl-prolyl cis-trans isomerase A (cyclophilin A)